MRNQISLFHAFVRLSAFSFLGLVSLISVHAMAKSVHESTSVSGMRYVHIGDQFASFSQDQLLADIKSKIIDPVDGQVKHLTRSYSYTVDGASKVNLSLVMEPKDAAGEIFLNQFVTNFNTSGFDGKPYTFQDVSQIIENVDFLAGIHVAGTTDNSFKANSEIRRRYDLTSIAEWTAFTNRMGHALQSKMHTDFMTYLEFLLGDPASLQNYVETVLNHDDVVFAQLAPSLQFADGTFSGADASPFFDMPFARSCWDVAYENGVCQTP